MLKTQGVRVMGTSVVFEAKSLEIIRRSKHGPRKEAEGAPRV